MEMSGEKNYWYCVHNFEEHFIVKHNFIGAYIQMQHMRLFLQTSENILIFHLLFMPPQSDKYILY